MHRFRAGLDCAMIYAIILVYLAILLMVYDVFNLRAGRTANYVFVFLILSALAGFRYLVGGDTYNYHYRHSDMPSLGDLTSFAGYSGKLQPIWILFTAIAKSINESFYFVQILHALIVNGAVFFFIRNVTPFRFTVVFLYSFSVFPLFNFEVMRESLAIALFLMAFHFYRKNQNQAYYSVATIAIFIHFSAFILFVLPIAKRYAPAAVSTRNVLLLALPTFIFVFSALLNPFFTGVLNSMGLTGRLLAALQSYSDYNYSLFGLLSMYLLYVLYPSIVLLVSSQADNRSSELIRLVNLAIWVGAITPLYFIFFRFINYFAVPLLIVVSHALMHFARSPISGNIRPPVVLAGLIFLMFFYSFRYFTDTSEFADDTRWYQRWYPYHSIFDPVQDPERMRLLIGIVAR